MFWIEDDLERLGNQVIAKYPELTVLGDSECRIGYQYCDKAKRSNGCEVYADTTLINEKLKQFINIDFLITFYLGNTEALDADRLEILMYHELCHVGYDPGAEGSSRYRIIPHDVEDFRAVIDKWGLDWIHGETGRTRTVETDRQEVSK